MQKYHTIVIGSGLGGLSAAATLARVGRGKKVLVLEQHSLIGGCATCFKRKGVLIDAGLHEMDYGHPKSDMKHLIFKKLGLFKKLEFIKLPTVWTISSSASNARTKDIGGVGTSGTTSEKSDKTTGANPQSPHDFDTLDLTIPHGGNASKEALKAAFPHEADGIESYFAAIRRQAYVVRRLPFDLGFFDFFFWPVTTLPIALYNVLANRKVADVLDKYIKDDRLKRILNINIAYYHHDPKKLIFSYHAIPQKHYYDSGAYIKGGSQALSDALKETIEDNNGSVLANADVVEILVENHRAIGVKYTIAGKEVTAYAKNIIANCDPFIVYDRLIKADISVEKDMKKVKALPLSCSLVSAYYIFSGDLSEKFKDMDYATFLMDEKEFNSPFSELDDLKKPYSERTIAFINYSKIDSSLGNDEKSVGAIAFPSQISEWDSLDKEAYKAKKAELLSLLTDRLEAKWPGIKEHIIFSELATPKTIARYTKTREGTPYGYAQDNEGLHFRANFKSRSLRGLYFASAFTFPGGGFTGALIAGYIVGNMILDPFSFVKRLFLAVIFGVVAVEVIDLVIKSLL